MSPAAHGSSYTVTLASLSLLLLLRAQKAEGEVLRLPAPAQSLLCLAQFTKRLCPTSCGLEVCVCVCEMWCGV